MWHESNHQTMWRCTLHAVSSSFCSAGGSEVKLWRWTKARLSWSTPFICIYISHPTAFLTILPPLYFIKHDNSLLYVWVLQQCHVISASFHAAFLFSKFYLRLSLVIQTDQVEYFPNLLNFSYIHPGKCPRKSTGTASWMLIGRTFCLSDFTAIRAKWEQHKASYWRKGRHLAHVTTSLAAFAFAISR